MNLHLVDISRNVAAGAHALIVLDGAGWHQTGGDLRLPANISLLHLPPLFAGIEPGGKRLGILARKSALKESL